MKNDRPAEKPELKKKKKETLFSRCKKIFSLAGCLVET